MRLAVILKGVLVPRRIGGLETAQFDPVQVSPVPRRIGGLEKMVSSYPLTSSVLRRIGGLESRHAD